MTSTIPSPPDTDDLVLLSLELAHLTIIRVEVASLREPLLNLSKARTLCMLFLRLPNKTINRLK